MSADPAVVIVAARKAWPLYIDGAGYLCQPGRAFRDVEYLGFYANRTIYPAIARIRAVRDGVNRSPLSAARFSLSPDPLDRALGALLQVAGEQLWTEGEHKAFLLSARHSRDTVQLGENGLHHRGRSAWTMGQRYTTLGALRAATSTADLEGIDSE